MPIKGAGGTKGGVGKFFIGLVMMIAGGYLFLNSIQVTHSISFGLVLYSSGSFHITTGMVLIPLIFGIGIIFYNASNPLGWVLSIVSLVILGFGVLTSLNFRMQSMTAFELLMILILLIGGIGLFLSSLKADDDPS